MVLRCRRHPSGRTSCAVLGLVAALSLPIRGETLVVGLPDPGRVPFFWEDPAKGFQGTYVELLKRIAAKVGFTVEFRLVPQARLIAEFNAGMIDVEPGISPSWRPSAEENALSRYSAAFMNMEDVLIVPGGRTPPRVTSTADLARLDGLRVGQVRGFFVPAGLHVIECVDEGTIARQVDAGFWDVGLMNAEVARWYKARKGYRYEISAPYASTPVALRFHVRCGTRVEPVNRAILDLRKSGELRRILRGRGN
jgi:ABC-type amino acid transport substrate-binding protein